MVKVAILRFGTSFRAEGKRNTRNESEGGLLAGMLQGQQVWLGELMHMRICMHAHVDCARVPTRMLLQL